MHRLIFFAVLIFSPALVHAAEGGLPRDVIERIDALVTSQMARGSIPGFSIAIATDLKLRWSTGYGTADLENMVPATADTNYRLASISKSIVATCVMQLVERGQLDLDAPIQKYVPSFPQKQWPVTPRQLLGHVGGIRTYKEGEMNSTRHYASLTEAITVFKDDPLEYQPGTKFIYSSEGFTLLAVAVENVSHMNYFEYAKKYVFDPAGMVIARPDSVADLIPHRTQGYVKLPNGGLANSALADTSTKPVVCTTAAEVAKFAIAFLSGKLVRPETVKEMFKAYPMTIRPLSVGPMGYGMGWNVLTHSGTSELEAWKAGNQQRVTGLLFVRPEKRFVLAMLCNLEDAPLTAAFAQKISEVVLGDANAKP